MEMKIARTRARTFSAVLVSISPSPTRLPAARNRPLLSLIPNLLPAALRRIGPGAELDHELAIEGCSDALQSVDARRPLSPLDPGDCRLGSPAELGQFALGDSPGNSPLRDSLGDQAEQLSIVRI
jgi:hypothetical protein